MDAMIDISAHEIMDAEHNDQKESPEEVYRFAYTQEELHRLDRLQKRNLYMKPILFLLICVVLILFLNGLSAPDMMIGFAWGMLYCGAVFHFKAIHVYSKSWKNSLVRICKSAYEYRLFENYIEISIYRNQEKIRVSKCYYSDIEKIYPMDEWLLMQIGGQSFILRKSELKENSAFYAYMHQNPAKTGELPVSNRFRLISNLLFAASLLSVLGAVALVSEVSAYNGLFAENMWLFYLFAPLPISSVVVGFMLKNKGYKYKKNIIAGIIVTLILCIYGSFTFIF